MYLVSHSNLLHEIQDLQSIVVFVLQERAKYACSIPEVLRRYRDRCVVIATLQMYSELCILHYPVYTLTFATGSQRNSRICR